VLGRLTDGGRRNRDDGGRLAGHGEDLELLALARRLQPGLGGVCGGDLHAVHVVAGLRSRADYLTTAGSEASLL
jgi:hypothetical protein